MQAPWACASTRSEVGDKLPFAAARDPWKNLSQTAAVALIELMLRLRLQPFRDRVGLVFLCCMQRASPSGSTALTKPSNFSVKQLKLPSCFRLGSTMKRHPSRWSWWLSLSAAMVTMRPSGFSGQDRSTVLRRRRRILRPHSDLVLEAFLVVDHFIRSELFYEFNVGRGCGGNHVSA
jgi:hypothetical protein